MPGAGFRAGPDAVDAQLLGHLAGEIQTWEDAVLDTCDRHAPASVIPGFPLLPMMGPVGLRSPRRAPGRGRASWTGDKWRAQRDSNPRKTQIRSLVLYPD